MQLEKVKKIEILFSEFLNKPLESRKKKSR